MKKSNLRATTALQALAILGAGLTASMIVATPASAQDYTSGAVIGTVTDDSGRPVPKVAVTMRSVAQNQTRSFVTNGAGVFTASGLTPGVYDLTATVPGYKPYNDSLTITASQESRVTVGLVSLTQTSTIIVTGRRLRQTSTQGTTGLNIDVAAVNANAPIAHDIASLTLLAPTTALGVRGFQQADGQDVPSIGGSSVGENAYYINGLNITNPDTYVGSARVPFYFYKSVDVQTGGYPAEFGRATGGVINATTKSGSNIPFIALHLDWEPKSLQSHNPNTGDPTAPDTIGKTISSDNKTATLEAGGAIVPDHLFIYGLIQGNRNTSRGAFPTSGYYAVDKSNDPFWGGKLDAYINPTQHFEFTIFDTRTSTQESRFNFTSGAPVSGGGGYGGGDGIVGGTVGTLQGKQSINTGGLNWVARYTGNVTDFFTLSGAYGVSKDAGNFVPADQKAYLVSDRRSLTTGGVPTVISAQTFSATAFADTKRRFYRGDADLRFTAAGQHHIRFGFDNEDLSETKTYTATGLLPLNYSYRNRGVRITYEALGGHVSGTDTAFYLEDSWNTPLAGLTLNLGIRDDLFKQYDLSNEQFANYKNNWGPRVGFNFAPPSLEKWRFFGSVGRNFIPPAMNLGFRGKDVYFRQYFDFPVAGDPSSLIIDPTTGLPTTPLGAPQTTVPGYASNCPVNYPSAPGNPTNTGQASCVIFGAGVQNPSLAKVVPGTKSEYSDEAILGTRYQANSRLSFGLQGTYRKLGKVSEDTDFAPYLANYFCGAAHLDAARCDFYSNNSAYYIWNPGSSSVTLNDWVDARNGKVTPVTLTGLQFPKGKRTYKAVVFDFNRADDGHWLASGSVTWSKSVGNTEGTVKSDAGDSAQTDAGSTTDFDYLGLTDYSYGRLPNDHRWAFKLFGAYHFNKNFTLGANIFVQSPMHGSCQGVHPTDPYAAGYTANSFFCGVSPDENGDYTSNVPSPRGTGWKSNWLKVVNLSARVNIPYGGDDRKITLRADVFNVFNSQAITQRHGQQESGAGTNDGTYAPDPLYLRALSYQTPRYVRLGLDVFFGGHSSPAPVVEAPPPPPPPPPVPPPATQTCIDGTVMLATATCPVAPPPPPPPPPPSQGERG